MKTLTALLIGDFRPDEFCGVVEMFSRAGKAVLVRDVVLARSLVESGEWAPDLVVLACAWPGQFSHGDLYALKHRLPLARFLSVLGSWCEGEARSGKPWPAMLRSWWHHCVPHWSGELQHLIDGRLNTWGLPQTATDDERVMFPSSAPRARDGMILVKSQSFDMADMLSSACQEHGWGTIWVPSHRHALVDGIDAIIWESTQVQPDQIGRSIEAMPSAPIILLLDFPRIEDVRLAHHAGVSVVMGKPLKMDDMFRELQRQTEAGRKPSLSMDRPWAGQRDVA